MFQYGGRKYEKSKANRRREIQQNVVEVRGRETDGKTGYQPRPVRELRSKVQTES